MADEVYHNEAKHRFEIDLRDSKAVAIYEREPGKIRFTHTKVPPQHEGKGIGSALVRAGLQYARDHKLKVAPVCPFFAAYMKAHAEVQDLLDQASPESLGLSDS